MHVWASLFSTSLGSPEPRVVMGALEVRFIQRQSGGLTLWEGKQQNMIPALTVPLFGGRKE